MINVLTNNFEKEKKNKKQKCLKEPKITGVQTAYVLLRNL